MNSPFGFSEAPRTAAGGIDPRYTFLRGHVACELAEAGDQASDVLAVDHLRQLVQQYLPDANTHPLVRRWVNRRQFFYRSDPDLRLYVPVRVCVAAGYLPHATDDQHYRERARRYAEESTRLRLAGKQSPRCNEYDLRSYAELPELLRAMHARLNAAFQPDRRGVVLLARSGAGKTVASRKAFYDCVFATAEDPSPHQPEAPARQSNTPASKPEASARESRGTVPHARVSGDPGARSQESSHAPVPRGEGRGEGPSGHRRSGCPAVPQAELAGFMPCWVRLTGQAEQFQGEHVIERLILRTLDPKLTDEECLARHSWLQLWLQHGPPLLLFFDLNSAPAEAQLPVSEQLVKFQEAYGAFGHRCVVTFRSTRKDAPAMLTLGQKNNALFGFYDLLPLEVEQATHYLRTLRETERCLFQDWLKELLPAVGGLDTSSTRERESNPAVRGSPDPASGATVRSPESGRPAVGGFGEVGRPAPSAESAPSAAMPISLTLRVALAAGPPLVRRTDEEIDAECQTLEKLAWMHVTRTLAAAESLISTPLLMHFVASLPSGRVQAIHSLTDLYREVIDAHLDREKEQYTDRWTALGEGAKTLILTSMTRLALVIQSKGRDATRISTAEARSLLANPRVDPKTNDEAAYVPVDPYWSQGHYFTTQLSEAQARAVLELSLLRWDGDKSEESASLGFVHDSFIYHLVGTLALLHRQRPNRHELLDAAWRQAVVGRMYAAPESWELPAQFLSGALVGKTYQSRSVLEDLLRDLILACAAPSAVRLLLRFARGVHDSPLLQSVERALKWHPGFLGSYPSLAFAEVINYLSTIDDPPGVLKTFAGSIESAIGEEEHASRCWLRQIHGPSPSPVRTMAEHTQRVNCVAVLADDRVVSGSDDHTVKLWDPSTGEVRTMAEHTRGVNCVAVLADGRIVSGGKDGQVKLWDSTTGKVRTIAPHIGSVVCVAVFADGRVVLGGEDRTLKLWDPSTGNVRAIVKHFGSVCSVAVLTDGRIVSGRSYGTVQLLDLATGQVRTNEKMNIRPVRSVTVLADGRVVLGNDEQTVKLWDPATGEVRTMAEHTAPVNCVAVLSDGRAVSGSGDSAVKLWDPATDEVRTMAEHTAPVKSVAVLADGRVVSGSDDHTVKLWDPTSGEVRTMAEHTAWVACVAVLSDGRVVSGSGDRTVKLWDPSTQAVQTPAQHTTPVESVAVLADGRFVLGNQDGTVMLWDPATGEFRTIAKHRRSVNIVVALADGRLISRGWDGKLTLWDPATDEVQTMAKHIQRAVSMAVLADGRVVSGSIDHTVKLWDPATGQVLTMPRSTNDHTPTKVAVLSDGRRVISLRSSRMDLWDPVTGQVRSLAEGSLSDTNVAALADGRYFCVDALGYLELSNPDTNEGVFPRRLADGPSPILGMAASDRDHVVLVRGNGRMLIVNTAATHTEVVFPEEWRTKIISFSGHILGRIDPMRVKFFPEIEVVATGTLAAQPTGGVAWHPNGRQIAIGTSRGVAVFELRPLPRGVASGAANL